MHPFLIQFNLHFSIVKPLTVKILDPPSSMIADRRYEVSCESSGSRPNAIITWYKGKRQLRRTKVSKVGETMEKDSRMTAIDVLCPALMWVLGG